MDLVGHGKNTQEAILHLKENFENYKSYNSSIFPDLVHTSETQFAAHDEVERYEEIKSFLFRNILEMNYASNVHLNNKSMRFGFSLLSGHYLLHQLLEPS